MRGAIIALGVVGCTIVLSVAELGHAAGRHYDGHVSGVATGPGHSFVVGDGLNIVFRDFRHSGTPYKVCWSRGQGQRCWHRTTGRKGHASVIFQAAPSHVGNYTTRWYVHGRVAAQWSFYNGVGD
jgi:hypothetical protein